MDAEPVQAQSRAVNHLVALVDAYMDETGVRATQLARRAGVSPQALSKWRKGITRLPDVNHLAGVAAVIRQPYRVVLEAALRDTGYLPANGEVRGDGPPPMTARPTGVRQPGRGASPRGSR